MTRRSFICVLSVALVFFSFTTPPLVQADVEWSLTNQIKLDVTPLDLASSPDGRWMYILAPGEIDVYSVFDGAVVKRIPIERSYDRIVYAAPTSSLLASSSSGKSIKIIRLDLISTFDFAGLASKGPANAPVTITVFSDYQCPYCKTLFPIVAQVMEKYPGQVRMFAKNFPLPSHTFAQKAAMASLAAGLQGKFWEFHDKLFENMSALNDATVRQIAKELGLDLDSFARDIGKQSLQDLISRDVVEGNRAQVEGTPTVFLNGRKLANQTLQGFQIGIDDILSKTRK